MPPTTVVIPSDTVEVCLEEENPVYICQFLKDPCFPADCDIVGFDFPLTDMMKRVEIVIADMPVIFNRSNYDALASFPIYPSLSWGVTRVLRIVWDVDALRAAGNLMQKDVREETMRIDDDDCMTILTGDGRRQTGPRVITEHHLVTKTYATVEIPTLVLRLAPRTTETSIKVPVRQPFDPRQRGYTSDEIQRLVERHGYDEATGLLTNTVRWGGGVAGLTYTF
jgi:hypothetical protein